MAERKSIWPSPINSERFQSDQDIIWASKQIPEEELDIKIKGQTQSTKSPKKYISSSNPLISSSPQQSNHFNPTKPGKSSAETQFQIEAISLIIPNQSESLKTEIINFLERTRKTQSAQEQSTQYPTDKRGKNIQQ